ncbi:MAG: ABC transporter permease [Clostridiales bacterium]|nr:ABC transporter permease [Clostridiales bacterium]
MIRYIIKRILWMIPVLLGVIIVVFSITYFTPGDPVVSILSTPYTQEAYDAKAAELGLDKGYFEQLATYIWNIITKFDLGKSFHNRIPIMHEVSNRLPFTLRLNLLGLLLMVAVGLPLGMISALKQYSVLDTTLTAVTLIGAAIPSFILALLCLLLFGVTLRWLPVSGLKTWQSYILPVGCPAFGGITIYLRMTRTTMLEVIRQDYIRTARAKGQKEGVVIRKHALRNCLIPLTTVFGGSLAMMFSGSIIGETIFGIPGMGTYLYSGIVQRDYPVINGVVFMISFLICAINLLVDVLYGFIDPRIRSQYTSRRSREKAVDTLQQAEQEVA